MNIKILFAKLSLIVCCFSIAICSYAATDKIKQPHAPKQHKPQTKINVKKSAVYCAYITTGDLKGNLNYLARKYHWHLVWTLGNYNYKVVGNVSYFANDFNSLVKQVISDYPLRATIYKKNKVLVIKSVYNLHQGDGSNE